MYVRPEKKTSARHGSILVVVLVSLLVASLLGFALIKTVLIHHRQMRMLGGQQQGLWLAEAGIQRAVRELVTSPEFEGEQWTVPADTLGGSRSAQVTIEVERPDDAPDDREIRVEVRLDEGRVRPNVYRREYTVSLPSKESTAES
jgi:hypothetical protein